MKTTLEQMLRSFLDGQRRRQRPSPRQQPSRRDWTDVMCFSCGKSGHAATRCPFLQPGWQAEKAPGGFIMTPPQVTMGRGKRRLIRKGGRASRVSDQVRPREPGGGAVLTVSPQRMTIDDVFHTLEQSGGGPQLPPPPPRGVSTEWTEEIMAEDTADI